MTSNTFFATYFRYALLLPMLVAAIVGLLPAKGYLQILVLAVVYTGIPYSIFAVILILWSRKRDDRKLKLAAWLSPIVFIPFSVTGFLVQFGGFPNQLSEQYR